MQPECRSRRRTSRRDSARDRRIRIAGRASCRRRHRTGSRPDSCVHSSRNPSSPPSGPRTVLLTRLRPGQCYRTHHPPDLAARRNSRRGWCERMEALVEARRAGGQGGRTHAGLTPDLADNRATGEGQRRCPGGRGQPVRTRHRPAVHGDRRVDSRGARHRRSPIGLLEQPRSCRESGRHRHLRRPEHAHTSLLVNEYPTRPRAGSRERSASTQRRFASTANSCSIDAATSPRSGITSRSAVMPKWSWSSYETTAIVRPSLSITST